jgi:hypothetical protein
MRFCGGKRIQLRLMAFLIFLSSPVVALAAKIDVVSLGPNKPSLVTIDGLIELHDKDQFLQKINNLTSAIVVFNSDGGNLLAGIQIGETIRLNNFASLVRDGMRCSSSCALAWLGGTIRLMAPRAQIGFHAASNRETGKVTSVGNALIGAYLNKIGLPYTAVVYITTAAPEAISWLSKSDAEKLGIEVSFYNARDELTGAPCFGSEDCKDHQRPFCFGPEDCKNHPDYLAFDTPTNAASTKRPTSQQQPPCFGSKISDRAGQPSSSDQVVPVAQRVVLYEEDPSDPKGKQYVGSVIWRTEPIKATGNQKADIAVRAEIEIPDRKFKMTMSFCRNTDNSLPASHTAELTFILPQDFSGGGVGNVPGILMKSNEQARGTPLAGLAVRVIDGSFLIRLSNVDADRSRNLQLLKERSWFDVPLAYANQRRAIIAIEKGAPGERAFKDALAAWGRDYPTASAVQPEPGTGSTWGLMFKSQVERCWKKPPYGSEETSIPEAAFAIRLKPDGTLQGMPVPEKSPTTPFGRAYQASALHAIIACQPYSLPAAYFDEWKYLAPVFTEHRLP